MKRGRRGKADEEKEEWREAGKHGREETERERQNREKKKGNEIGEVNLCSALQHEHIRLFPQHGGCGSLSTPAGCRLTFEISLLRQGEGWRSLSSGDLASVCKYRAQADGGKLASVLEPYGAYAHGGVCKDPGHGVRAEDRRLLRLALDTRH
ncbi:hypothetical protein ABVT39_020033 [Epinephelus coioides]